MFSSSLRSRLILQPINSLINAECNTPQGDFFNIYALDYQKPQFPLGYEPPKQKEMQLTE